MPTTCNPTFIQTISGNLFWEVTVALVIICIIYNWIIDLTFKAGYERDTTVWFVVGGVIIIMAGFAAVYSLEAALVASGLFVATGIVMILGAFRRNVRAKAEDANALMEAVKVNMRMLGKSIFKKD